MICKTLRADDVPVSSLVKEEKSYVKEAQEQEARVAKIESEGKEEWEVKKQKEVLQDCLQMIPDCKKRLEAAVADLQNIVVSTLGEFERESWS